MSGRSTFWLTRALFLRLLGGVYFVAFLALARQVRPLVGESGLLPARQFLDEVALSLGSRGAGFVRLPSLFWLGCSDGALAALAWVGVALGAAVALGFANAPILAALWVLQLSFVAVGQLFWGYGWEILLAEAGFLAIFLAPALRPRPLAPGSPPSTVVIHLYRWLLFRVMFGAGLIKLRGDPCWRALTCLVYHYETQPIPNPLSWLLHQAPPWVHAVSVAWNHFVELVVPFFLFWPRRVAVWAGLVQIAFQLTLILSGNLSFLNWLTLAIAVACLDDCALARVAPARVRARLDECLRTANTSQAARIVPWLLAGLVALLSIAPVANLLSPRQVMNGSFEPLHLVNTYGAFGSVGRVRNEIVLEGASDENLDDKTIWREYQLPCKPGDPMRRPCVVAPWQPRLDWQLWFAAMSSWEEEPWLVHLVAKLLRNDAGALSLLSANPFPDRPPRWIRARLYEYRFTRFGEPGWWRRTLVGEYMAPTSLDDPDLADYLARYGWKP